MTTKERVEELYGQGIRQIDIAKMLSISRQCVNNILCGYSSARNKYYKNILVNHRYKNKCQKCKQPVDQIKVHLHHKDRDCTNNHWDNLMILCEDCHIEIHRKIRSRKL